jgi:hypothetical protein
VSGAARRHGAGACQGQVRQHHRAGTGGQLLRHDLPLPGWADCSFYGARTYVCDSQRISGVEAAALVHARTVDDVKTCLRDGWTEDASRASSGYAVIRGDRQAASITINTDQTEKNEHVVRLILFLRSSR